MEKRRCKRCGTILTSENVMKVKREDRSWLEVPLPLCPNCFTERMRDRAIQGKKKQKK